ncbi:hypothetical protein D3C83_310170 [compost metagenome]
MTLRFFGERAIYAPNIVKALPTIPDLGSKLAPGDAFRDGAFLKLHPPVAA